MARGEESVGLGPLVVNIKGSFLVPVSVILGLVASMIELQICHSIMFVIKEMR